MGERVSFLVMYEPEPAEAWVVPQKAGVGERGAMQARASRACTGHARLTPD